MHAYTFLVAIFYIVFMVQNMAEEQEMRRNVGWLFLGIVVGGLMGIVTDLWAAYFVKWVETTYPDMNWTLVLIVSTIIFVVVVVGLYQWALRQIRRA